MNDPIEAMPDEGLAPGAILYQGDFNPGKNTLVIRTARVRDAHGTCLILDTGDGDIETIPLAGVSAYGWERTEYHALQRLLERLQNRACRLDSGIRRARELMQFYSGRKF